MSIFSQIWHDSVWAKVIAAIIFFFLTPFLTRIQSRNRPFWGSFIGLGQYRTPVWVFLVALLLVYLGTHLTNYDYYIYLGILFTGVLLYSIFIVPSLPDKDNQPILTTSTSISNPISPIGPSVHKVWFDSDEANLQCLSVAKEKRWENDAAVGEIGEGQVSYLDNKMIEIRRTNRDGRVIVKLDRVRPYGVNDQVIVRDTSRGVSRKFSIELFAKTINGSHVLWFMAKHAGKYQWVHNANDRIEVSNTVWKGFSLSITVPSTEDFELYFEDREVKLAPSSIQIRNLKIVEY